MRIMDLAIKDLAQILRDKRSLIFLVLMPVAFTLFMGFAYKSGGTNSAGDTRTVLGWVNQDPGGRITQQLYTELSRSEGLRLVELDPTGVDEAVSKGRVAGALVIPSGFSANTIQSAGQSPNQLRLVTNPGSLEGQTLLQTLRGPLGKVMSAAEIAALSAKANGKASDQAELESGFSAAAQAWEKTGSAGLVKVEMAVAKSLPAWYGDNPYNQASPGILVQFAIFGLVTSGQILVQERKTHTLQRMMSTSMHTWQIVAGHLLAMFVIVFVQELLLVVFGQAVLGVGYARQPLAILALCLALGAWIAALGLFIGVIAASDSQVVLIALLAMFIFSAMGGTWFPLESASGAFAAIGKLLPSAWAMNGFQNILIRGLDAGSCILPALALLGYGLAFFALAVWRFRAKI